MISPLADQLLTEDVRGVWGTGILIRLSPDRRVGVWLSATRRFDSPDGLGDSVAEALENAAHKIEMAARKGKA